MGNVVRSRASLQRKQVITPASNPDLELTVKKADSRAVISRQNLFDKVRYISDGPEGETITERSFPMGELRLETVMLVLIDWNITDEGGNKYPITHKNVSELLEPAELMELYDGIIEMNEVWGGAGEASGEVSDS